MKVRNMVKGDFRIEDLLDFMAERHSIYVKRMTGDPKPWTNDKILQSYRFCNVYRELDTQTKWLAENWGRQQADGHYWFACLVFRFINWDQTAAELGYPVPWDPKKFIKVLDGRKRAGKKVYSGAYMISTHGVKEAKASYLAKSLSQIWKLRDYIDYKKGETLEEFSKRLEDCFDVGTFLAGQVVADMKFRGKAKTAPDWWTFAVPGPGSRRGLNRVIGREPKTALKDKQWHEEFRALYDVVSGLWGLKYPKWPQLSAQDLQNCLCEFDKYERTRLGEGRPKSTYKGAK